MSEHLGYDKHDPAGRNGGNSRNGVRTKTVLTEIGPVDIEVLWDREGSFDPQIVRKRQRRLDGIDQIVLSLTARGLTTPPPPRPPPRPGSTSSPPRGVGSIRPSSNSGITPQ